MWVKLFCFLVGVITGVVGYHMTKPQCTTLVIEECDHLRTHSLQESNEEPPPPAQAKHRDADAKHAPQTEITKHAPQTEINPSTPQIEEAVASLQSAAYLKELEGASMNCTFDNPAVTGILFMHWHIPKSGGTTVRDLTGHCPPHKDLVL